MTTQTLQTNVNYRRRDATESFISNDEILAYLNEGLQKAQADYDWEFTKISTSFTFTNGSSMYALSAIAVDNKFPIGIFYTDDYDFEMVSPDDVRRLSSSGNYNMYATDNAYLYVDTSFGSGTLQYHYYSTYMAKTSGGSWIAQLSTSSDVPLIPDRWQSMLIDYAAARCYQKEGLNDDYSIAYNDFIKSLERMKREFPSRRKNTPKRMIHINELSLTNKLPKSKSNPLDQ